MTRRRQLLGALWLAVLGATLPAQVELEVLWRVPRAGLTFGDRLPVEIVRRWPAGAEAEPFDERVLAPLQLQLVTAQPLAPGGERRRYDTRVFASGELVWPPLALVVRLADGGTARAVCQPPPLVVRSLLPEPPGAVEWPDVVAAPAFPRPLVWLLGGAVLLVGALWWQRGRTRVPTLAAAPVPDGASAVLAALHALTVPAASASPTDVAAFYRQLAALVRAHGARHLPVPADTRTSEQVIAAVAAGAAELRACLQRCDAVKFAAARPGEEAHAAARAAALAFVQAEGA